MRVTRDMLTPTCDFCRSQVLESLSAVKSVLRISFRKAVTGVVGLKEPMYRNFSPSLRRRLRRHPRARQLGREESHLLHLEKSCARGRGCHNVRTRGLSQKLCSV